MDKLTKSLGVHFQVEEHLVSVTLTFEEPILNLPKFKFELQVDWWPVKIIGDPKE